MEGKKVFLLVMKILSTVTTILIIIPLIFLIAPSNKCSKSCTSARTNQTVEQSAPPITPEYLESVTAELPEHVSINLSTFKVVLSSYYITNDNVQKTVYYSVIVEDDQYWFGVFSSSRLIEKYSGECLNHNGTYVLKNLKLRHTFTTHPGEEFPEVNNLIFFKKDADNYDIYLEKCGVLGCITVLRPGEKDYGIFELRDHVLRDHV